MGSGTGAGGECGYNVPYHPQAPTPASKTQAKKGIHEVGAFGVAAF